MLTLVNLNCEEGGGVENILLMKQQIDVKQDARQQLFNKLTKHLTREQDGLKLIVYDLLNIVPMKHLNREHVVWKRIV